MKIERNGVLYEDEPLPPTSSVGRLVSKFHQDKLVAALAPKKIHGVFFNTNLKESRNAKLTHEWLRNGSQRAEMEALIVAAQDGVVMTRAYLAQVLKMPVSVLCRRCHKMPETIGHILSRCEQHFWSLYKERHDRVLAVVLCTTT